MVCQMNRVLTGIGLKNIISMPQLRNLYCVSNSLLISHLLHLRVGKITHPYL